MALKAVLSKTEVDALPEVVRALYVERDGKYVPDVDGGLVTAAESLELKTRLREFRDNNTNLLKEVETLRPIAKKFEGVDPDEYKTLKDEVAALKAKGVTKPDDIQAAIDKAVAAAQKPVLEKLAEEAKAREVAQKAADAAKFRELVGAEATKAGVDPRSVRHVLREAEQVFELKDGALMPKPGVKHPTEPLKDLSPTDWLQGLSKTDDYLFQPSNGGGAPGAGGGGGGNRPGVKILKNPSPEEMGRHLDGLAKGEVVVVRE